MFTRKPTTSSTPVILLKYNVELITGIRFVNLSLFCFSICQELIIKGTVDKIIKLRQENAKYISTHLSKIPEIIIPSIPDGAEHIHQLFTIRLRDEKIRDNLHEFLIKKQIFSKVYFKPIHLTSFYRKKFNGKEGMLPITENIAKTVLTLPLYPNMTQEEKKYLIDSINEFFNR